MQLAVSGEVSTQHYLSAPLSTRADHDVILTNWRIVATACTILIKDCI